MNVYEGVARLSKIDRMISEFDSLCDQLDIDNDARAGVARKFTPMMCRQLAEITGCPPPSDTTWMTLCAVLARRC